MINDFMQERDITEEKYEKLMIELGFFLKFKRQRKGITVMQLSHLSNIGESQISRIENAKGKLPTVKSYLRLCYALEIKPSELFACLDAISPFDELK